MHFMTDEDFRIELLIWILIGAFEPKGYVEPNDLHRAAIRYKRELERRGMEFNIYPDLVTDRSREVDSAAIRAIEYHVLGLQDPGRSRAPIIGRVDPFLKRPREGEPLLIPEEVLNAKEAARAAFEALEENRLDDDLKEEETPAATK